jgi:hypothetical protein
MEKKTFTSEIYEVETETEVTMIVQIVAVTSGGKDGKTRKEEDVIGFLLTDEVSEDWKLELLATISKAEARELAKLLIELAAE